MKNYIKLGLLSLLALPLMAGCGGNGGEKTSPEETINKQCELAFTQISVGYADFASSSGISIAGASLVKECKTVDGFTFSFKYSIEAQSDKYMMDYLTLSEDGYILNVIVPEIWELPSGAQLFAAYTLHGTASFVKYEGDSKTDYSSFVNKEINSKKWNVKINSMETRPVIEKIKDMKKKHGSGDSVIFRGYVTGYFSREASHWYTGVFVADGEDGVMLYSGSLDAYINDLQIGMLIQVMGEFSPYNGLVEIKPATRGIAILGGDTSIAQPVVNNYTSSEYTSLVSSNSGNLLKLEGLTGLTALKSGEANISSFDGLTVGQHWTLSAKMNSKDVQIYVNYHVGEAAQTAIKELLIANQGKGLSFNGVLSWYNGAQVSPLISAVNKTAAESFIFE